jgi:hypothetical protein
MQKIITTFILLIFSTFLSCQTKPTEKTSPIKTGAVKSDSTSNISTPANSVSTSISKITPSQIIGSWQLVDYQYGPQAKKRKPLTTCDTLLRWNFEQDSVSNKLVLKVVNNNDCADFGFESDWQISGNNLLIKRTKILGFGGVSASGSFIIKQISADKMILEFQQNKYIFQKM